MIQIPTIEQLYNNILAALMAEFDVDLNPAVLSFLTAFAGVLAGILWLIYLAIGLLQQNIWVDTCDMPTLIRYGVIILGRFPYQAVAAQYTINVSGTAGAVIPATMVWISNDTSLSPGYLYQITGGAYVMPGTTGVVTVTALTPGTIAALNIGDALTATAPMVNVNAGATVLAQVTAPVAAETEAIYRQNVIEKIQLQPGSWSAADYRLVGTNIDGVLQTYAYATSGSSNNINVWLQGEVAGTPIAGTIITEYQTALELVRPMDVMNINYAACPINNVGIVITAGTFAPFTSAQQALIIAALTEFVNGVHPFIAAADNVATRNDVIATYNLNAVISAAVPGYGFSAVTFTVNSVLTAYWQADQGNVPFLTGVTFA